MLFCKKAGLAEIGDSRPIQTREIVKKNHWLNRKIPHHTLVHMYSVLLLGIGLGLVSRLGPKVSGRGTCVMPWDIFCCCSETYEESGTVTQGYTFYRMSHCHQHVYFDGLKGETSADGQNTSIHECCSRNYGTKN